MRAEMDKYSKIKYQMYTSMYYLRFTRAEKTNQNTVLGPGVKKITSTATGKGEGLRRVSISSLCPLTDPAGRMTQAKNAKSFDKTPERESEISVKTIKNILRFLC